MIRFALLLTALWYCTNCKLPETQQNPKPKACDVDLRFEIDRNSSIPFFNSSGSQIWVWQNDSMDFIYAYFHVDSAAGSLVRISSVEILNGGTDEGQILNEYLNNQARVNQITGSWLRVEDCRVELNEWMLNGNYHDSHTPYLYEGPDANTPKTQFDPRESWADYQIKILAVQSNWLQVEVILHNHTLKGWMPAYNLCAHPHTSCN